jgi:hypothetical protein
MQQSMVIQKIFVGFIKTWGAVEERVSLATAPRATANYRLGNL